LNYLGLLLNLEIHDMVLKKEKESLNTVKITSMKNISVLLVITIFLIACKSNREIERHSPKNVASAQSANENMHNNPITSTQKSEPLSFKRSYSQKKLNKRTVKEIMKQMSNDKEISSYQLMNFGKNIGGLIAMYRATDSIKYIEEALLLTERIIKQTQRGKDILENPKIFKDDYLGWENKNEDFDKHPNGGRDKREIPLFESRFLRYVAEMLYIVKNDTQLKNDKSIYEKTERLIQFLKINGWQKWYVRGENQKPGCYPFLFRSRTHMTSHWAIVALYLEKLSNDKDEKKQYRDFLNLYNQQLKSNLRLTKDNAYIWNMTWDNPWPFGTECNKKEENEIIQDVDHGNHVVAYIIAAYELGDENWTKQDVQRLCNTVKYILYDKKNIRFFAGLDQNYKIAFADGIRMSDGFQYLSRYDKEVYNLFEIVLKNQNNTYKFRLNEPQYVAEKLLAEKILNHR